MMTTRLMLILCGVLLWWLACGPSTGDDLGLPGRVAEPVPLVIHRVVATGESPRMRQAIEEELGCGPCAEIEFEHPDGEGVVYLYNRQAQIRLDPAMIVSARTETLDGRVVLLLQLAEDADRLLRSHSQFPFDEAANFVDGTLIDIVPLIPRDRHYAVGRLKTPEAARALGDRLGVALSTP